MKKMFEIENQSIFCSEPYSSEEEWLADLSVGALEAYNEQHAIDKDDQEDY